MYPAIYKNLKHIVTQICRTFKLTKEETRSKGRPLKIKKEDALALALYQHRSTRATKKSIWTDFRENLRCSYKTLVVSMNKVGLLALSVLFRLMRLGRKDAHFLKFTDATDIPVCLSKNGKHHRTMRGLSGWGYSGKGFYFGLKMTMTRDDNGRLLALAFSPPRTNDREILKRINRNLDGVIVADAGYVSKKLEEEMHIEGRRWLLVRPLKTMKRLAEAWQLALYDRRVKIEFDFRSLKLFHGLVSSLPRSIDGYIGNYLFALLSFVLR